MKRRGLMPAVATAILLVLGLVVLLWWPRPSGPTEATGHREGKTRPEPPRLLESAQADENTQPWQRLLAANGSGAEDLAALRAMVEVFLQAVPVGQRPPLGFDTELAAVLADPSYVGDAALPASHPALRGGRLIDRWGTPWLVHPVSADDLVSPRDDAER